MWLGWGVEGSGSGLPTLTPLGCGGVGGGEAREVVIHARELKCIYHAMFFFLMSLKNLKKYDIKGSCGLDSPLLEVKRRILFYLG